MLLCKGILNPFSPAKTKVQQLLLLMEKQLMKGDRRKVCQTSCYDNSCMIDV